MKVPGGLATNLAFVAFAVAACSAIPLPSAVGSATPGPTDAACDPARLTLAAEGFGGAGGTTFAVLGVRRESGPACLLLSSPAVDLVDARGHVIASGPAEPKFNPPAVRLTDAVELRLGWSSWCASPPPPPLVARLHLPAGTLTATLPDAFLASCQGAETKVYVEPIVR